MNSKDFRLLIVGQTMANLGDVFYIVALVTFVYTLTGSALYTALFPALRTGAQFVSGILAPLMLDRFRLHALLLSSQLSQTILLFFLIVFANTSLQVSNMYLLYVFILLLAFLDGWTTPTRNAMIPLIVNKDQLLSANSLLSTVDQTVQMVGWSLGGIIIAWIGGESVLWLTFGLFVISTISIFFISLRHRQVQQTNKPKGLRNSLKEGWMAVWHNKALRVLTFMDVLEGVAGAVWMSAILLVYVDEVLHKGEAWWGFINSSYFIGTILGGVIVMALAKRLNDRLVPSIILGTLFAGALTAAFAFVAVPFLALLFSAAFGPVYQLQTIAKQTICQRSVGVELFPKVLSAQMTLSYITFAASVFAMTFLADHFGVKTAYYAGGALILLAGLIGLICKNSLRPSGETEPVEMKA